ncbi:hypothetical protein P5V15_008590 [Pogonomyrmex californicus]
MPIRIEKSTVTTATDNKKNCESFQLQKTSKPCARQALDAIPITAKAIKIKNVQNPCIMRVYEIENHTETLRKIEKKLLNFMQTDDFLKKKYNENDVKIDDMVFVYNDTQSSNETQFELPSFVWRGLVKSKRKDGTYCIFLVDHGTCIELTKDKFCIVPQDFISDKYLTKTVGIYGMLPICIRRKGAISKGSNAMAIILEKWTEEAIQFTKHLLSASESVHFDHLITDKNGREYGEIYLTINNIVISLSETLFNNYHAVYIEGELLKYIETSTQFDEKRENVLHVRCSRNKRHESNMLHINGIDHHETKFSLSEKIVIQSTIDCGVLNDLRDLRYPRGIHQSWNECINSTRPRKLQSYIWPAINKGLNVVAIGSSQCGKTTGCVMAVCGQIATHQNEIHSATHPLALILCASSTEVIYIQSLCESFLRKFNNLKSVGAFNGKSDRSIAAMIYNGCQILVTTPRYLVRFLNKNKGLLSFDKLSCLLLDNADIILDKYFKSLGELFKIHKIIENRDPQSNDRPILQIIMSATECTIEMKKFVSVVMHNPYICIGSFVEAIVFKSIRPKLSRLISTDKNKKILELLKDIYTTSRTAIVCINAEEAEELNSFLLSTKKTLLIHEKMKSFDIRGRRESWMACVRGFYPILICTDLILSDLNLTNIQWLIHHSVFSLLLDNLMQDVTNCKVHIIVDENNNVQFPYIVRLLQRTGVVVNPDKLNYTEEIKIMVERNKKEFALCDNIKSFGFCNEQNSCEFRHCVLPEIDVTKIDKNIQINDKVKLMVMYIHDTTHFSARIIEHIPNSNEKKITYSNIEYVQTAAKIQNYYSNIENRKVCKSTNVGDICVFEETIDIFKRVQIRRIRHDRNHSGNMKFVDVRCIDTGIIHECIDAYKLMHIPEELLNLPTHAVEIFLADLMPYDEEYTWNRYTNEEVHKWFSENFDKRSYIFGRVRLHLRDTIWLDDLEIGTKLIGHPDLIGSSLKKKLLAGDFAVMNDNHISNLFKLCKNSGLTEVNGHNINSV